MTAPIYAESSALSAWVLQEPGGPVAQRALEGAPLVYASALTILETHQAIRQNQARGILTHVAAEEARESLLEKTFLWKILDIDDDIVARAGGSFPDEHLRSLDAIQVATALKVKKTKPGLRFLSFDHRVWRNARDLGLRVVPEELPTRDSLEVRDEPVWLPPLAGEPFRYPLLRATA